MCPPWGPGAHPRVTGGALALCRASAKKIPAHRRRFGVGTGQEEMEQRRSGRIWGFWLKISPWDVEEEPCGVTGSWGRGGTVGKLRHGASSHPPKRLVVPVGPSCHPPRSGLLLLLGGVSAFLMLPDTWSWNPAEVREGTGVTAEPGPEVGAASTRQQNQAGLCRCRRLRAGAEQGNGLRPWGLGGKNHLGLCCRCPALGDVPAWLVTHQ